MLEVRPVEAAEEALLAETCTDFLPDSVGRVEGTGAVTGVDEVLQGGGLGSLELAAKRSG
jgi:hypothetical protein